MSYRALAIVESDPIEHVRRCGQASGGGLLLRCRLPGSWAQWWNNVHNGNIYECSNCGKQWAWRFVNGFHHDGWRWVEKEAGR